jgi:hypothetical protein
MALFQANNEDAFNDISNVKKEIGPEPDKKRKKRKRKEKEKGKREDYGHCKA